MSRQFLLELYSGAAGAGMGYENAGFTVVSVDIEPQPRCPFPFLQADALKVLDMLICGEVLPFSMDGVHATHRLGLEDFVGIHTSPPCQGYSRMSNCRPGLAETYPKLVDPTRDRLIEAGLPYVIENVVGAPLIDPITLCGTMFGYELYRHRLFEASFPVHAPVMQPGCSDDVPPHPECGWPHVMPASKAGHWKPGTVMSVAGHFSPVQKGRQVMGINWMNRDEMAEAVPPFYTEYIGSGLKAALASEAA